MLRHAELQTGAESLMFSPIQEGDILKDGPYQTQLLEAPYGYCLQHEWKQQEVRNLSVSQVTQDLRRHGGT